MSVALRHETLAEAAAGQVHGSAAVLDGKGVLVLGPAGAGKSSLVLALMTRGARLVADDRTDLTRRGDQVIAAPPATLAGKIEARNVGILAADYAAEAPLSLIVDLSQLEEDRVPLRRSLLLLGLVLPILFGAQGGHFPDAILHYLRGGRVD